MSKCERHSRNIEKYDGTLKELAEDIGDLHYEELPKLLLLLLEDKFLKDALNDRRGGRIKLANVLLNLSSKMYEAAEEAQNAWNISKPYMDA